MGLTLALSNGDVIIVVVVLAVPLAAIAFAGAGSVYDEIGKGDFAMDHEPGEESTPAAGDPAAAAIRDEEIRQLLEAKAYRQEARGEQPLDVEAEMEAMRQPQTPLGADPQLVEEVRQLVVARNERRLRQGKDPLDVEAEVARQLSELESLGQ